uniref:Uncharacterized protein n=1 Tax=Oryza sativa subsp. japonica TaxID=39947 RepID=Q6K5U3_ORYSJ|nr:hypothetical protein [Oryza sativa Japonica Group]
MGIKSTGTFLNPKARFRTCTRVKQISHTSMCFSHEQQADEGVCPWEHGRRHERARAVEPLELVGVTERAEMHRSKVKLSGVLHMGFKPDKCKTALRMALARIKLLRNRKELRDLKKTLAVILSDLW